MALLRAPPGKEAQYLRSFIGPCLLNISNRSDDEIIAAKRTGTSPITDPQVAVKVKEAVDAVLEKHPPPYRKTSANGP